MFFSINVSINQCVYQSMSLSINVSLNQCFYQSMFLSINQSLLPGTRDCLLVSPIEMPTSPDFEFVMLSFC